MCGEESDRKNQSPFFWLHSLLSGRPFIEDPSSGDRRPAIGSSLLPEAVSRPRSTRFSSPSDVSLGDLARAPPGSFDVGTFRELYEKSFKIQIPHSTAVELECGMVSGDPPPLLRLPRALGTPRAGGCGRGGRPFRDSVAPSRRDKMGPLSREGASR